MTTPLKVHGADLSHHNTNPNLRKAKAAGLQWVIHKATEGSTYTDPTYAARRKAAREAGLTFGAYGFARPDERGGDAKLEALHLFKVARPAVGDIVPTLDFEVAYTNAEAWCKSWQREMKRLLRESGLESDRMLHYGPDDFGVDYKAARWVPRYNRNNTPPNQRWDIFQFSDGKLGVPNSFPGLGNVDLNHVRPGFNFDSLILRKVRNKPAPKFAEIKLAEISLQFSDTLEQQRADIEKTFSRARKNRTMGVMGTEAGDNKLWKLIVDACRRHGYRANRMRGNWVAVDKEVITPGTWSEGDILVMDNDKVVGRGHDPAFPWVKFRHKTPGVGFIALAAIHYPTKGRRPSDPNHWVNRAYARRINAWAKVHGAGSNIVFVGGDFNMPVREKARGLPDLFFGHPFTTASEEVGKFYNTGHGAIDHIASYDPDARVKATDWRVYNDRKFFLHTDHFYTEADFSVRLMAA